MFSQENVSLIYLAQQQSLRHHFEQLSRSITTFKDECTANCYEIEVITSKDPKSGTDDKIEIQLEGQNGIVTEWFQLDSPSWFYNDFETDLKTTYYAQACFQNKITK